MNKKYTLGEIAKILQLDLQGDPRATIHNIATIDKASSNQISFLEKAKFKDFLATSKAGAIILSPQFAEFYGGNKLLTNNPYLAYAKLSKLFNDAPIKTAGIHPSAIIGNNTTIPDSVSIGPNCVIEDNVTIGANTIIEANCVINANTKIGHDCHFHSGIIIYHNVQIGNKVIIHSGSIIGADGFGNANDNGKWIKIYQLGSVRLGNDIEIGANTCIDRGTLEDTIIEDGVRLDNQIQIAHNVHIGAYTAIAGYTGIAGSATIGKYCLIGGGVSMGGHISIADKTIITGGASLGTSITEPGIYSSGIYAQPHRKWLRILSHLFQLDKLVARVRKLEENYE